MKIKLNGYIHCRPADDYMLNVHDGFQFSFWAFEDLENMGYALVAPCEFEAEIPDNFDPRGHIVQTLQERKKAMYAEFQTRLNEIDNQIARYTALEYAA